MSRLTQGDRANIERVLVERAFKKADVKMRKRKQAAALSCYRTLVPHDVEKQLDALPDGWVPKTSSVDIDIPLFYQQWDLDQPHCCPSVLCSYGRIRFNGEKQPDLVDALKALKDESEALDELKSKTRGDIRRVLAGITSWKRLLEAWPEAKDVIEPLMPEASSNAIACIPQELNTVLDLP